MKATVKWFNNAKGFGFIESEEYGDIFIHYTNIINNGYKTVKQGQQVIFEVVKTDKGYQARNIEVIKELETII